ncbi:hypothetical protein G4B88_007871, partial [Cannabis sativa]
MYHALLQEGVLLLITINSFGCIQIVNILLLLNVFGYGLMIVLTNLLTKGDLRRKVIGLICLAFNIGVFVAHFSTMRQVIKTRSVEFMSFLLSFFITLGAIMLFFILLNVLVFFLSIGQMILYFMFKNAKSVIVFHENQPELEL